MVAKGLKVLSQTLMWDFCSVELGFPPSLSCLAHLQRTVVPAPLSHCGLSSSLK